MQGEGALCQRRPYWLLAFLVLLLILGTFAYGPGDTRYESTARNAAPDEVDALGVDEKLTSWNPSVSCTADRVTIAEVLGPAYPLQRQKGGKYEKSQGGGVPNQRALSPPCTITNKSGQVLSSLVQIEGVYVAQYGIQTYDCRSTYDPINGGGPYPNGRSICDNLGYVFEVGTSGVYMQMEIDRDWLAKGYCGPGVPSCDNVTLAQHMSYGRISLDVQGFVYWDGENWELHPFTAWRLSAVSVYPASRQIKRNETETATVSVHAAAGDSVTLSQSGCPGTTQCTFSPSSGSSSFTSTFSLATNPGSPMGTFVVVIAATNSSGTVTVPFRLTITHLFDRSYQQDDGGGFSQTEDTYIQKSSPNLKFGAGPKLLVDGVGCVSGTSCRKVLVKFPNIVGEEPGQIPAGSRVVDARLELILTNTGSPQDLFQVTESWTESTATWNSFTNPGTPGRKPLESTVTPATLGLFPVNLTSIVQRWVDGEGNQGIMLESTGSDAVHYQSSETPDKPTLTVVFDDLSTPPPFDFSLAVTPASGSIAPGGSVSASVTATLVSGSAQEVQYSCADLPLGGTCAFAPPTCTPTCTASLVLGTSSNTSEGTYAARVEASNGTITRSAAFTLIVVSEPPPPPPFDFSVAVNPSSGTVAPGGSASTTATATLLSGSTQAVQYSCANLPAGTNCAFTPPSCNPTCSAALVIATAANTTLGTYAVMVSASNGSISRTAQYTLTVTKVATLSFQKGDGGPFSETDDAYIYNGTPNGNYGSQAALFVDAADCIARATVCRSLLTFPNFIGPNTGQVPAESAIVSATLELTVTNTGKGQLLFQVTEAWTESAVTWNTFAVPGSPSTKATGIPFVTRLGVIRVNVTSIVQSWANGEANLGFVIRSASSDGADYNSSESNGAPKLIVTFAPKAPLGSSGSQASSTPPFLGPEWLGPEMVLAAAIAILVGFCIARRKP